MFFKLKLKKANCNQASLSGLFQTPQRTFARRPDLVASGSNDNCSPVSLSTYMFFDASDLRFVSLKQHV